jgi:DNA-binding protein WhiA
MRSGILLENGVIKISFCSELKNGIYTDQIKKNCCKKSMLMGFIAAKGIVSGNSVRIYPNTQTETDYVSRAVLECFKREVSFKKREKSRRAGEMYFHNDAVISFISQLDGGVFDFEYKCPSCKAALIRGLFLASGRVTDPKKAFHLEFSLGKRAKALIPIFEENDLYPKYTERKSECLLYFKTNSAIADFFAIIGENKITMDIINGAIRNEYASTAIRKANADSSNIFRVVNASGKHVDAINKLKENGKFALLPDDLKETAELRLEFSEVSLTSLGSKHNPPISKSGVNHRLQKILEFAE